MLIGIIGAARVGKDTFAEMLAESLYDIISHRFILMSYATELKLRIQKDIDLSYDQLWGDEKEIPDKRYRRRLTTTSGIEADEGYIYWTPREIMQAYGEFYRGISYDFWVNSLFRTIHDKDYKNVIVTDIRYPNEAVPIKEEMGYLIKITSDRDNKQDIHGKLHISETAMLGYNEVDFEVANNSSLEELRVTARKVANFLIEVDKLKING